MNKLAKFAEMATYTHVVEAPFQTPTTPNHELYGRWHADFFKNDNPIVLELGCGRGEYCVGLGRMFPDKNFIGVDIKGARMYSGATEAKNEGLTNVAFLRTHIEFIDKFFAPGEVAEIWLTFSDPQLRGSENARLTSPLFLQRYHRFLKPRGIVHLKTDSRFLYEYTQSVIRANGLEVLASGVDIYNAPLVISSVSSSVIPSEAKESLPDLPAVFEVQTFYESMFLKMGLPITYVAFRLDHEGEKFASPTDFDAEYWREAEGPRRSFSHQPSKNS